MIDIAEQSIGTRTPHTRTLAHSHTRGTQIDEYLDRYTWGQRPTVALASVNRNRQKLSLRGTHAL